MKKIIILIAFLTISNLYAQKEIDCDSFLAILNENRILVQKGRSIGVIDTIGNVIIDFKYRPSYTSNDPYFLRESSFLLATDLSTDKDVLLNLATGKNVVKAFKNIRDIYLLGDNAIIETRKNNISKKYYINRNGKILFNIKNSSRFHFQQASAISENKIRVLTNPNEEYKKREEGEFIYIDTTGNNLFNKTFTKSGNFYNNRAINAEFKNGIYYYGFIDDFGNQKIDFLYTKRPTDFSDNTSRVKNKARKYGYIDNNGKLFIQPKYDKASGFYKGYALVKNGSENWKIINKKDEVIKEFLTFRNFSLKDSSSDLKKIKVIKQIVDEGIFKVTLKRIQVVLIDYNENIIFDNKTIRVDRYKYGLAKYSYYDTATKIRTNGIVNKNKKIILTKKINQF